MATSAAKAERPIPDWLLRVLTSIHVTLHKLSLGRAFHNAAGHEFCFLSVIGAKSGKTRVVPLLFIPQGNSVLLVASKGGAPRHPAWFHNLLANPDVVINRNGQRYRLRARVLDPKETATVWPLCVARWPGYDRYEKLCQRTIPVIACEPIPTEQTPATPKGFS